MDGGCTCSWTANYDDDDIARRNDTMVLLVGIDHFMCIDYNDESLVLRTVVFFRAFLSKMRIGRIG